MLNPVNKLPIENSKPSSALDEAISLTLWPFLFLACVACYQMGLYLNHPILAFNIAYICLAITLFFLERARPHEAAWLVSDGQIWNDIGHTLLTKGFSQVLATSLSMAAISQTQLFTSSEWPSELPFLIQVILGLVIAELGLYWAHRLAHEWWPIWCWHAVHHSVTKLWFVNTGRFHLFDSLWKSSFALTLGLIAGAPKQIIMWVLAITPFIGFLTHCNVRMECGWLNWFFNTPQLHRWHHSRNATEGNSNYGENLVIWDIVFGTRYLPKHMNPPANIGCDDPVPTKFLGQLAYPFMAWLKTK